MHKLRHEEVGQGYTRSEYEGFQHYPGHLSVLAQEEVKEGWSGFFFRQSYTLVTTGQSVAMLVKNV